MAKYTYAAMMEPSPDGGFGVSFPDLPGCVSFGENLDDAVAQATEAMTLHLEGMVEDGDPLPTPQHFGDLIGHSPREVVWAAVTADIEATSGERVNVYLPKSLLNQIERFGSSTGIDNRSTFFRLAARSYLLGEGATTPGGSGLTERQAYDLAATDRWFRYWMPYCFRKVEHPRRKHVWLPLNRKYKPLGILADKHVDYQDFLGQAISFKTDPALVKGVWSNRIEGDREQILYLYSDGTRYRTDYFARLERVMALPQTLVAKISRAECET